MLFFLSVSLVVGLAVLPHTLGYPSHAQCQVFYQVPGDCNSIREKILDQMEIWNQNTSCPGSCEQVTKRFGPPLTPVVWEGSSEPCQACPCGQKCLYGLEETRENTIRGTHTTPVHKYVDNISFTFDTNEESDFCTVEGFSSSSLSYAVIDFGTNYCNLRNLMDGAGLSQLSGYSEDTSVDTCMQLDQVNCIKF